MISDFKLVGLSLPRSGTLELLHTDKETFWATFQMSEDRVKALFNWAKSANDFWNMKWIAEVEHEGFYDDGTPIMPIITGVREWSI